MLRATVLTLLSTTLLAGCSSDGNECGRGSTRGSCQRLLLDATATDAVASDVANADATQVDARSDVGRAEDYGVADSGDTGASLPMSCVGRCGANYDPALPCQCNTRCGEFGNCCSDHAQICGGGSVDAGTPDTGVPALDQCAGRCGTSYDPALPCQCNDTCASFGNCCSDYAAACNAPQACSQAGTLSGHVTTSIGNLNAASTGAALVRLKHRIDIDANEDRCVNEIELSINLQPNGCTLHLTFETDGSGNGRLISATFLVDSFCPGVPNADEGTYRSRGIGPLWANGVSHVPDPQAATSCIPGATITFPDLDLLLETQNGGASITINLDALEVQGSFNSTGDSAPGTRGVCRTRTGCQSGSHNGGGGVCTAQNRCSSGYFFEYPGSTCGLCDGAGEIQATGTCVTLGAVPVADQIFLDEPEESVTVSLAPGDLKLVEIVPWTWSSSLLVSGCTGRWLWVTAARSTGLVQTAEQYCPGEFGPVTAIGNNPIYYFVQLPPTATAPTTVTMTARD